MLELGTISKERNSKLLSLIMPLIAFQCRFKILTAFLELCLVFTNRLRILSVWGLRSIKDHDIETCMIDMKKKNLDLFPSEIHAF